MIWDRALGYNYIPLRDIQYSNEGFHSLRKFRKDKVTGKGQRLAKFEILQEEVIVTEPIRSQRLERVAIRRAGGYDMNESLR
ncbi:hypothetical protein RUM44_006113 [Polyplax serrata]|uniref:Uncharacterized protein n=1 Tax=Polyplax serrata TaxID=468196 RepID=A0ABR1AZ09_POLSC